MQVRGALDQNTQATTRYLDKNSIWKSMYDYFQKKSPEEKKKYQKVQDSADTMERHRATVSALFSLDFFKVFGIVYIPAGLIFFVLVSYIIEKAIASRLTNENDAGKNLKSITITNFFLLSLSAAGIVFLLYSYFESKGHVDKHTSEKVLAEKEFARILNETFHFKYNEPFIENKGLKKTENPVFEYIPDHLILAAYQSKKVGKRVVGKSKTKVDGEVVTEKLIKPETKKSDVNPNAVQKIMTEQDITDLNGYEFIEVISEHINKEILCLHEKTLKGNTVNKLDEQFEDVMAKMKEKPQFVGPTGEQGIATVAKPPEVTVFFGDKAYTGSIIYKFKGTTEVRAAIVKLSLQVESQKMTFLIPVYGFKTLDHEPPESYMNNTFHFPALPFLSKPINSMAKAREHFGVFTGNNNNKPKASDNNNEIEAEVKEVNQPGFQKFS